VPVVAGAAVGGGGRAPERLPRRQLASSAVGWRPGGDVGAVLGDGAGIALKLLSKRVAAAATLGCNSPSTLSE